MQQQKILTCTPAVRDCTSLPTTLSMTRPLMYRNSPSDLTLRKMRARAHTHTHARTRTHTRSTKWTFAPNCNNLYTDLQLLLCNLQYEQVYFCRAFRNRGSVAATNLPPILAATFATAQSRLAAVTPQVAFTAANLQRVVQLQQRKAVSSMQSLPPCFAAAK